MADNAITAGLGAFDKVQGIRRQMAEDEWRKQEKEAELSYLEDKTKANQSGFRLKDAENNAGLELMPLRQQAQESNLNDTIGSNAATAQKRPLELNRDISQINNDTARRNAEGGRLPTVEATNDIKAQIGLSDAQNERANQPTRNDMSNFALNAAKSRQPIVEGTNDVNAQIGQQTAQNTLTELPKVWAQQRKQGAINDQTLNDKVIGTMGTLIKAGDKQGLIDFANSVTAEGGILPETNGHKVVDVLQDKQGGGYQFVYEDGAGNTKTTQTVPAARFQDAMSKLTPADFHTYKAGDGNLVAVDKRGNARQVYQSDPSKVGQEHKPAEVKTAEWLIQNGVAKDANQAWNLVSSAKEKTRSAFVMDYVSKNAMPGQDTSKIAQQAGTLYDTLKDSEAPAPTQNTQKSNNPQGDKLLKKLNLGVP